MLPIIFLYGNLQTTSSLARVAGPNPYFIRFSFPLSLPACNSWELGSDWLDWRGEDTGFPWLACRFYFLFFIFFFKFLKLFFIFILFISVIILKGLPDTLFWESHAENLYFFREPRTSAELPIPEYSRGKTQSILLCREFFMEVCYLLSVTKLWKSHQPLV